jgi:hypothetical protein
MRRAISANTLNAHILYLLCSHKVQLVDYRPPLRHQSTYNTVEAVRALFAEHVKSEKGIQMMLQIHYHFLGGHQRLFLQALCSEFFFSLLLPLL